MYTGASANVSVVASAKETRTSSGNRNAAICATEFLTTEIARSERPFQASTRPAVFSTALPAIATITRPAKAWEMWSTAIAGSSALTNQSETNAEPTPATTSSTSVVGNDRRGPVALRSGDGAVAAALTSTRGGVVTPPAEPAALAPRASGASATSLPGATSER